MALTTGTLLGRYKIRSPLGAGGMGEVYLAVDIQLERTVALKVLPSEVASDQKRMGRFKQEARAASTLNHPNVAHIYEIGEAEGVQFIAMEFVEGRTLRHEIASQGMKTPDVMDVALQVSSALAAAHTAGIVHRDIKPENIMLRPDGYVKVLDFGLAKLTEARASDSEASTLINTDPGIVIGTVQYMSPEQARGREVDARTDIFSLGVVLYEMIAGRAPFEAETKTDVISAILNHDPPPLTRYSREVPETLEWIINKALRKDREERYQSAKDLLADLKSLKRRLEFAAEHERSLPPEASARRFGSTPSQSMDTLVDEAVVDPKARTEQLEAARSTATGEHLTSGIKQGRRGIVLALAGLLFAAAAIFLGFKYLRHDQSNGKAADHFSKLKVTRLTTSGKVSHAAISPDGKYVVSVVGVLGQQSISLRHVATGSDKEIVTSNGSNFYWVTFSPDGGYILYVREEAGAFPVYQVPVLGGPAKKLTTEDADTPVTFSPDGKRFAFMRGAPQLGETSLIVANADGTGEQKLVARKIGDFNGAVWSSPSWSPDGEIIAFAHRTPEGDGRNTNVIAVRVADGVEKQITFQKWFIVDAIAWLSDGSGLIITAVDRESGGPERQVWQVSYPGGEARRITNDTNNYVGINLTADSTALVTVQSEQVSNIWVAPNGEAGRAVQLPSNRNDGMTGVTWTPDGHIIYSSNEGSRADIWIMNADGTNQKQLTSDARNTAPAVSPDGRYIVYLSTRAGDQNIWRMDIDGSNTKQLTSHSHDILPSISPDGQWVFYTVVESDKESREHLRKVSIDGGDPVQVTDYPSAGPLVSPDGKLIACGYINEQERPPRWRLAIISVGGGPPIKTFDISALQSRYQWASDGRALLYSLTRNGITNIWSQPVDGSSPKQLTDFKSDQIFRFNWSRDGKQLVLARGHVTSDVIMITDLK